MRPGAPTRGPIRRGGVGGSRASRHRSVPAGRRIVRAPAAGAGRRTGRTRRSDRVADPVAGSRIDADVQTDTFTFDFETFELAWDVLAGVTTAQLAPERREEAERSVRELMWTDAGANRTFRNTTQFIVGVRRSSKLTKSRVTSGRRGTENR